MAEYERVCGVGDLPPGTMKRVRVGGREVALVHTADGRWYAVGDRCTHLRASLSRGSLEGTTLTCPWHGTRYDVTSGRPLSWVARPAWLKAINKLWPSLLRRRLPAWEVRLEQDEVQVRV